MSLKRNLITRVLLNQYHQGPPDALLASLSKESAKQILEVNVSSQDASYLFHEPKELARAVHYSWLRPVIEKFPPKMQPFLLTALPSKKCHTLSVLMKKKPYPERLSMPVRLYFLRLLTEKLKPPEILSCPYLPASTLTPLLGLSKGDIIRLIDFLGLHDLAIEIKHIVDKKYLKAIYNCLSIKKQHYLRICLHQKERLTTPRLGLDTWKGDCKTLEFLVHKRGLLRIGKGLAGQHEDFLWHLIHKLDAGRGAIIQRYYTKEEIPGVTQVLMQEILNLLNFFKKNE